MIDLHTHTFFSDGELIPAELARRAAVAGYTALAMTDHGDRSNLDLIIPRIARISDELGEALGMTILPGVELTHVPPAHIARAAAEARELGAKIISVHGETLVEPVAPGTNRAALEADIDILAHPGLLTIEDAQLAARRGIYLELTTRKGHSLSNGHVAKVALAVGAKLVVNNDAHAPGDLLAPALVRQIVRGAGLSEEQIDQVFANSVELVARVTSC
jgi:histidinol phosphatase-like PHP family hydrolase